MSKKIPFSPPYIDQDVIQEVVDTLSSGWITTGPKVKALEENLKAYTKAQEVLCLNSWTSAAILMLKSLGLSQKDEVLIPAYTYSATALAVIHAGATPIMVDSDKDFNLSLSDLKQKITEKTKVIIPVDIAGYPNDYESIYQIIEEKKSLYKASSPMQEQLGRILLLEDAAHSFGAEHNTQNKVGSLADVVIFSLHAVKNITSAEGGAIALNMPIPFDNTELKAHLKLHSLNCQTKDAFSKTQAGAWKYDIVGLGMKINMPDICASIALAQLKKYSNLLEERRKIFSRYSEAFAQYHWAELPPYECHGRKSSCHLYALRIKGIEEEQRDLIIQELANEGISLNVHFIPMPLLSYFSSLGYQIKNYPVAYDNYKREISLPIYPGLSIEDQERVIQGIVKAVNKFIQ